MPKIKNKYTGSILEVSHDQLKQMRDANFPMVILEENKPKKPDVLSEFEKKSDKD